MNVNKSIHKLLLSLLYTFIITFSQSGFGATLSSSRSSNQIINNVIKITDNKLVNDKSKSEFITFKEASKQLITIENNSDEDINLGNMFYIGDEFTTPLVTAGISLQGSSRCSMIKSGTACSFSIEAEKNASATVNPDGELFLLAYKTADDKEEKFIKLKIKITYNNDLFFKPRNIKFSQVPRRLANLFLNPHNKGTSPYYYDQIKHNETEISTEEIEKKSITIYNNQANSILIKDIKFGKEGVIGKIDHSACTSLAGKSSCEVGISIDPHTPNGEIPIFVTYDSGDKQNVVAVAAAITRFHLENSKLQPGSPGQAVINGFATATAGLNVYIGGKKILVAIIGDNSPLAKTMTHLATNTLAGVDYAFADAVVNRFGKYEASYGYNRLFDASAMHIGFAILPCATFGLKAAAASSPIGGLATGGVCMVASVGCGLAGTFIGTYLTDALYSNIVYHLPEQLWGPWLINKSKMAFNFGVAAVVRLGCKAILSSMDIIDFIPAGNIADKTAEGQGPIQPLHVRYYSDGWREASLEFGGDVLAGTTLDLVSDGINKLILPEAISGRNSTVFDYGNDCKIEGCNCYELPKSEDQKTDL